MKYVQTFLFGLVLSLLNDVQGEKTCDLSDIECTTKAGINAYKAIIAGIPGLFEPIDPMYMTEVKSEWLSLNFGLNNGTLTGMTKCQVTLLKLNEEDLTSEYHLQCPQLILSYYYDTKGLLGPLEFDGKGFATITLNNYLIVIKTMYGKFIAEVDKKLRLFIISYTIEFESKGNMIVDVKDPLHSDKKKAAMAKNFITENLTGEEKIVQSVVLTKYMAMFMKVIDIYLRNFPAEKIFPRE